MLRNGMTTIVAYGSLCSGLGLQSLGRVTAESVERVVLLNCRRGFGKLSQHGDRYAMVLEPLRRDEPIQVDSSFATSTNGVSALAVTVKSEDLWRIARREGYDPNVLRQLEESACCEGATLARYLWRTFESAGFDSRRYRRVLFERTGYTSPHYIPHPVARDGRDPGLIFLAPGLEGSGDESVVPARVATGMVGTMSVHETWRVKATVGQIEYFSMCLLAEMHGLSFVDVLHDLEAESELERLLSERLRPEVTGEVGRFRTTLGLSEERYRTLRGGGSPHSWLLQVARQGGDGRPTPSGPAVLDHAPRMEMRGSVRYVCHRGATRRVMKSKESFRVYVTKDYLKFSAAHFIAYQGFREALHGHNYRVSVAAQGELGPQGYVVDFGVVKRIARRLCDSLDETMLIPVQSDCLTVSEQGSSVIVRYEQDEFRFPRGDVTLLPIVHTSVEELARYLTEELKKELAKEGVSGITAVEVGVEESFGQAAYYRQES